MLFLLGRAQKLAIISYVVSSYGTNHYFKLFDACLNSLGETTDGLSMIDKANKLEKSLVLSSTHAWMELRRLRNSLTQEYPDQPEIIADILNKLEAAIKPMLDLYHKMSDAIKL